MLCRIYKKNNSHRPMDHEKDDSTEDMLGPIPSSMTIGSSSHNARLNLSKGTSFGALLENEQIMFDGMLGNEGVNSSMSHLAAAGNNSISKQELPLKRTLPSSYWTEEDAAGTSTSKRFQMENGGGDDDGSVLRATDANGSSIATLLSQLPQTMPSLHQQAMLGSIGDGIFRQTPYNQLQGLNWYT